MPSTSRPFDELAEAYDRYRTGYADEVYDVLEDYGVRAGSSVLDVACGTGLVTGVLRERGMKATGVDVSDPMLAVARRREPEATFVRADAMELPFPDASFDAATCAQSFHWFDASRALMEITRVVRPGGVVAIWWKELLRGDPVRLLRHEASASIDVANPPRSVPAEDFAAFEQSSLADRRLRVIPWLVETSVGDFIGYERSRARARDTYGARIDDYFAALAERLGAPEEPLSLSYVHLLYLGRVPADRA